jgi:transglutaminase-like putative cysteine protease
VIYDLSHVSTYGYNSSVASARCTIRIWPRVDADQTVIASRIDVTPAPTERRETIDFFGNRVTEARITTPHRKLRVALTARIDVHRAPAPAPGLTPAWELTRHAAASAQSLGSMSPVHFLFPSRLAPLAAPITTYARESFATGRPVLEGAADLMRRIYMDFDYDPDATEILTPLVEAFERRSGVCQDFAHIMIAGLRGLGLPAAYVSGYIRTYSSPGKPRLEGSDASHAWVLAWCGPEFGWLHFDPTNNLIATDEHIVVAIGRDYADVSPIDGVMRGSGKQSLDVAVDVKPVEA